MPGEYLDPALLDHELGLVEKGQTFLYLVHYDQAIAQPPRLDLAPDQSLVRQQTQKDTAI